MIETALIDADIVAYRCSAATENDTEDIACFQASEMMNRILHETNAMQYKSFLTGGGNFRYSVYPDYKANRRDVPKPKHLEAVRAHLVSAWNSKVTEGIEADDAIGIEHCSIHDGDSVVCSIDKDLLMLPGQHYNFVKGTSILVSPLEGLRNFYGQLILGDRSDNVPGFDGKMRNKIPKFLEHHFQALGGMTEEWDMFEYVRDLYENALQFNLNCQLLWIMRKADGYWQKPVKPLMEESGLKEDTTPSLHLF